MSNYFWERDFTATIRDFDFTRMAVRGIHRVVSSEDFADMDADMIFDYLFAEMETVSFKDYLKRYIYERAELEEPFRSLPDSLYQEIIMDSFAQNRAPHSFSPTTVKWGTRVKRWLEQDGVRRSTIFLLGFGLRMSDEDVSEFLTKVVKEADFDPDSPWEMVCRYCFANGLPYARAAALMEQYGQIPQAANGVLPERAPDRACTEGELLTWLRRLRVMGVQEREGDVRRRCFLDLYRQCQATVAALYQSDEAFRGDRREWRPEDVGPADLEKMLCDGIPVTKSGNLEKMSKSVLSRQFQQKRVTRQRLEGLLKGELEVDRFDLITLQFFLSAQTEDEDPRARCGRFVDEVSALLEKCGLMGLYPANPYEAFVLMCLLCDVPLITYYDVWERSYEE